jgi:hypothetical protein
MSSHPSHPLPSTGRLLKATALAAAVAGVVLITTVLPAEYGVDPTGIGARLGLDALASTAEAAEAPPVASAAQPAASADAADAVERIKAKAAFGESAGQTFDIAAVDRRSTAFRRDTLTLTLAPGKGAEVKALLKSGDGVVFQWTASGDVAVDMHGEKTDAKNAWTSYWVEPAQRDASGTFVAPFDGSHGWYWQNRGSEPVTVQIEVAGFQEKLYRPGQS